MSTLFAGGVAMNLASPQQSRIYLDRDMTEAEVFSIAQGLAVVYTSRCPDKDSPNEDAAALIPYDDRSALFVVCDGLGGVRAGERAAEIAIHKLKDKVAQAERDGEELRTAILNAIDSANRAVQKLELGAATTLSVVELSNDVIRTYQVGDSRILVVGQKGKIKLKTISHSPTGFEVAAGVLSEAEAMHHADRHIVSNVLGTADMRVVIGSTLKLAPRDTLILASDGLFDNLRIGEIVQLSRKGPLEKSAQRLATDSHRRMTQPAEGEPSKADDLTFVLFRPHSRR